MPPKDAVCATCGDLEDGRTGLCFACLMRSAAEPGGAEPLDIFADETELPRIGSYELIEEIGRGGMGVIYKARQLHTGRLVAVKILQSHIAHQPELLSRFRREAETAARLDHPHVLPIYEVNDEADGVPFFTMKLALGGSLVDRRATLQGRTREAVRLVAKVARAAHHAHERGVLHRDLKPGNILFDSNDEPLVSDFGLAAWLHQDSDLTRTVMVFGTPGYLPPEYLNGRPEVLSPASDLYSLGVILFELLTGRLPFEGATSLSALQQAAANRAPLLRTFLPAADRDLETICARCLETEQRLRYPSATSLAEDLERWLDGRPIVARRTPRVVRAWKLVRRHPAISITATVCALLVVSGLSTEAIRRRTETKLRQATAYDRSCAVLPVEDYDALSFRTPLAQAATQALLGAARKQGQLLTVEAPTCPEPFPAHAELVSFSRSLPSRYLLSATVRQKNDVARLVVRIVDAGADRIMHTELIEVARLDDEVAAGALQRVMSAFEKIRTGSEAFASESEGANPPQLALNYVQAGDRHRDRRTAESYELAIDAYQKAARLQTTSVNLARVADAMAARSFFGDRDEWLARALPIAAKAVETGPSVAWAQRTLSSICFYQGDFSEALEHALAAAELDPADSQGVNAVASAKLAFGRIDQAIFWNRKSALRQSTPGSYAGQRGDCFAMLGDFDEAAKAYTEALEFRPELAEGALAMAMLHLLEGKHQQALDEVRALQVRFPKDDIVVQSRAAMEFHIGDTAAAETIYREISNDREAGLSAYLGVRALSALGCLALERGDAEGKALVERALQLDEARLTSGSRKPDILFERAANLILLGRKSEALETLRKTLDCADWTYYQMMIDRRLQSVREAPEFRELREALRMRSREMSRRLNNNQPGIKD